ncbi:TIGR01906 family membrane protein [Arthrobacter sp. ok362]|uniref:TIGR01906 family membrane protein n=1 Tax=Arthrobacter sp. ok362 TaxID=1761745 RepID=UPI00088465FF|nr:TIGR01906 family membrane protein [Arthrobacter sp. ok362]SDK41000.1 integral membrane protein TIGR01906 [Arthrobacter sp. ok362]
MTDKSPTPADRPDPHLDPTDDTDEPAFEWMKPASTAGSAAASAGKPAGSSAAGSADKPAGSSVAGRADKPSASSAAGSAGKPAATKDDGAAAAAAAAAAASAARQPGSRADRKAAEAAVLQTEAGKSGSSAGGRQDSAFDETLQGPALPSSPQEDLERRDAERRNAEREQAAKAKPVLPRVMQVLLAVFYPVILLVLAVRAVTSPLFLWVEYNRPGFPGDGYGFSTDDRMTYGSYAVDYLSNWSGPRYLGNLVDQSGERLFKDGEVSHMADVKTVMLSTFGAGTLLILLGLVAVIYLKRKHSGGVRRGLFAGSIVTLAIIIGLGTLAVLGWEQFFTDFHHIFFANGTWTFTLQDTLIRLFPGQFWMDAGIVIGALVLLASVLTLILTWPTRRRRGLGKKKKADTSKDTTADAGMDATAEAAPAADGTAGSTGTEAEGATRTRHTV